MNINELKAGDCVWVRDEGLAQLRAIMAEFGCAKPNHVGRISADEWDDPDTYLVEFPIGDDPIDEHSQSAPFPKRLVVAMTTDDPLYNYWERPTSKEGEA